MDPQRISCAEPSRIAVSGFMPLCKGCLELAVTASDTKQEANRTCLESGTHAPRSQTRWSHFEIMLALRKTNMYSISCLPVQSLSSCPHASYSPASSCQSRVAKIQRLLALWYPWTRRTGRTTCPTFKLLNRAKSRKHSQRRINSVAAAGNAQSNPRVDTRRSWIHPEIRDFQKLGQFLNALASCPQFLDSLTGRSVANGAKYTLAS